MSIIGSVKRILFLLAGVLFLSPIVARAEDAMSATLKQVEKMAMRRLPSVPPPNRPRELFVPERRVWVPGLGVYAIVPGHWERRISDTQSSVPWLTIFPEGSQTPLMIPPAERPPAELRTGP